MSKLTLNQVKEVCAWHLDLSRLQEKTRKREVVKSRQILHYFAKEFTKASPAAIGHEFGRKDRTTVLHSHKAVCNMIDTDRNDRALVAEIHRNLIDYAEFVDENAVIEFCLNASNYDIQRTSS
ncbi:MAG: helix-turn-helix domain-containing protein [Bacteroidales bacterium]